MIRSSAVFAASEEAPLAFFSATTSTVLPLGRLDVDLAVDVADLDAPGGPELIDSAPLGRLFGPEVGGDDVAGRAGEQQGQQQGG